ncbi:MAG: CpsD/CapB family tyrosine-protein kinase [Pyrinomonadaceae bacterium]|nr:CpsD/CapB family tyrosine-protein kinase [Acidobacteriota bacterium]MBP7377046.1 CpsD/CapB family tyrosine-protein kinase [Pyrinomonadaceae bacterium]
MSILQALQKKRSEQPNGEGTATVVPFNGDVRRAYVPADLVAPEFAIGTPVSTFNGQPESNFGTALPDLETGITAGANLNVDSPTRSVVKPLPDFVSWQVDPERVEPRLVAITQPNSSYCEEYRSLRTHVLHKGQRNDLKTIVVASVNPSEGKSVTSINLSWLLAQTDGVRALIIDSDLRMPSLADYMGIETDRGLSDVLAGTATLKESIIRLEPSGLHLLPGGEARQDVAELISGPKFKEILREAREMFDYVIIDAPPLGIFTDATVLINHADGAILVVRANRTKYGALERILEPLPKDRMLGVVLNQSEDVMDESHYNYGYYNYKRLNEQVGP